MADVAKMSFEEKLGAVIQKTESKVGPEVAAQLHALIEPSSLAIMAGVLVAWVVGHAFGVGEIVDVIIGVVGVFSIGLAVFSGIDELYEFAHDTYSAKDDATLDRAAGHLAKAIGILGIQAVLAVLFKGRPRGGRVKVGPEPVRTPPVSGLRDRPTTTFDPARPAGSGATTFWGDIAVSTQGSKDEQAIVLLHEKVHQFLAPKFRPLRRFRVENRVGSYFKSSLYRYVEEALAESVGQIGVKGLQNSFVGLRFPVENGYVYLMKGGGYSPAMAGKGLLPEGAGLIASGAVQGFVFQLWFKRGAAAPAEQRQPAHAR